MYIPLTTLLSVLLFLGCKSDSSDSITAEEDTRLWVQEAYRKLDKMQVRSSFNSERVVIIKNKLDQETDPTAKLNLALEYGQELLKCGRIEEALTTMDNIIQFIIANNLPVDVQTRRNLFAMVGISYLRFGEVENCLKNHNHESCYLPIRGEGVHQLPLGSTKAIEEFRNGLKDYPEDLEFRYLLNVAYMTLGKYPREVPAPYLINPEWFQSKMNFPRYKDIAPDLGVNRNGLAGGVVVDDFTNDGWLDIVITSWGPIQELIFYKNNGDGTFSDQTKEFGLSGHVGILNLNQTDFNNDGWLDLFLMRGAWYEKQGDIPNTLLMNTGKGSFKDVTLKAGMTKFAPTQTSAWTDVNLDGWLDVVIGNESLPGFERGIDLYINQQDGTFSHASSDYGLTANQYFKGCVATYANDDRYPDLYFSAIGDSNSLYINQQASSNRTFALETAQVKVGAPYFSFPCWSFDFDNNGYEDLFVSSYSNTATPVTFWMESHMGRVDPAFLPKLYSQTGSMQYTEVGRQMGLTEVAFTMGCNYGDINTDGFLDFYLSTGNPLFQSLVPNKMYLNMEGKRFEDISYSGGFANIQKGHAVGFGDLDHDGDEDLYVVIGGAVDGDPYFNSLFENPNPDRNNWVVLKLEGVQANKAAIGARVTVSVNEEGKERKVCRTVSSGASFGGNSLLLEVGLGKATSITSVDVQWPCRECPSQKITGFEINKAYLVKEGDASPAEMKYNAVKFGQGGGQEHHHH